MEKQSRPSEQEDLALGELLIRNGLCGTAHIHECLGLQKDRARRGDDRRRLGEIMIDRGYLTETQLQRALLLQYRGRAPGDLSIPGYDVQWRIGSGSMGDVYRGVQISLGRRVAIKVLKPELAGDPAFRERFFREAKAAAHLDHPVIVRALDAGESGGFLYLVMEFVEGRNAVERLAAEGRFPESETARIGIDVARALEHAWSRGILHRDVKPHNLMILRDGAVRLCDLGLSKRIESTDPDLTPAWATVGTPAYCAPEVLEGRRGLDVRSDLYSLGATLYHLAVGEPPFPPLPLAEHFRRVRSEAPEHPRARVPSLRAAFGDVLMRLLSPDPAQRYLSPAETALALRPFAAERGSSLKRTLRRWFRP